MKDHPFSDWVNHQKDFEDGHPIAQSNHRRTTNQDSYASEFDKKGLADGWFIEQMPDLNQRNPFLALPNSKFDLVDRNPSIKQDSAGHLSLFQ